MSKGETPATQTQKTEIPDEFKSWIFGPGMYGGTQGGGNSGGFISGDIHKFHTGSSSKFDPLNLVKKKNKGSPAQYMDAGFEGILPMALQLAQAGNLSPTNIMSDTTKESQTSLRDLVTQLNTSFLPQTQDLFDRVGNRDLVNAQETQDRAIKSLCSSCNTRCSNCIWSTRLFSTRYCRRFSTFRCKQSDE
jgi:hypothetical protein